MCYGMMQSYKRILHSEDIVLGCRDVKSKAFVTVNWSPCVFRTIVMFCFVKSSDNCGVLYFNPYLRVEDNFHCIKSCRIKSHVIPLWKV